jgi:hypothetical protein
MKLGMNPFCWIYILDNSLTGCNNVIVWYFIYLRALPQLSNKVSTSKGKKQNKHMNKRQDNLNLDNNNSFLLNHANSYSVKETYIYILLEYSYYCYTEGSAIVDYE